MIRFNSAMKEILKEEKLFYKIDSKLKSIIESGFYKKRGCILLKELYQPHYNNYKISTFTDETGFEAFVHDIGISDYTNSNQLQNGLVLVALGLEESLSKFPDEDMWASISVNSNDVTVKFYCIRNGIRYLSEDLESYEEEAMLELDRNGVIELKKFFQPQDKI